MQNTPETSKNNSTSPGVVFHQPKVVQYEVVFQSRKPFNIKNKRKRSCLATKVINPFSRHDKIHLQLASK